jgi:ligand-binding SRPBCC domain-containing protein
MTPYLLQREQWVPQPLEEVFAFFSDARNLEVITPAWLGFRILSPPPVPMQSGTTILYRIHWHGFPMRWLTEIESWDPPTQFVDVQREGPYRLWHHTHSFESVAGGTRMRDVVRYALPLGILGRLAHACLVRSEVDAIFDYRARKISSILGAVSVHE